MNGWKKGGKIADDNRQRLFAVREVLERAIFKYPTQAGLVAWLDTPRGAEGSTPAQLLEDKKIDEARLLAVATPSPHLIRAQPWAKRATSEAFLIGEEHYPEACPPQQNDEFDLLNDDLDNDGIIVLDDEASEDSSS